MTTLQKGDKAPDFSGIIQDGSEIKSSDYSGKKLVVYFYPRDMTPTCTTQACNIRDNFDVLKGHGIEIIGVNDDPAKKHQKFIDKHELPFPLIADEERSVLQAFGVWGPKKFMGKEFDGTHRTTFLIDEEGTIVDVIKKVKAKEHTDQILNGFGL
ncbi:thioredoxin-dependent thiol peroxidase [Sanyastnella coralliicola]|uniref:thioredoxin-dependent thiol peroxidase n=1 Tax=Sanyastnella coralliicola TaxID=3069118 RepID=UPI0027B9043A|nr:thioredoxin-dependent thiol peroxidase [Longitalea sp. SCSIO 12813]